MANAFTHLPHRCAIWLKGPDTLALLERLVTNSVDNWPAAECRYGALLTPQGKVLADYLAVRTAVGVFLDCDRGIVDDFAKRLKLFRLRSDVDITVDKTLNIAAQKAPQTDIERNGNHLLEYSDPRYPTRRIRVLAEQPVGDDDLQAYNDDRIHACVPEMGADFDTANVFPSDINMDVLGGVDLKKGCFVGQEVVSRMHRRGKVRRRTITLTGDTLVPGMPVGGETAIGEITSSAGNRALARVRTDRLAKLLGANKAIVVGQTPADLTLPDWLQGEFETMDVG